MREGPRRPERGVQRGQPAVDVAQRAGQLGDRRAAALEDCAAKAAKKVLKLTISSPSCCSWTFSAAVTLPTPAISFEKSCGSVPVIAWLMIAPPRSAGGAMR